MNVIVVVMVMLMMTFILSGHQNQRNDDEQNNWFHFRNWRQIRIGHVYISDISCWLKLNAGRRLTSQKSRISQFRVLPVGKKFLWPSVDSTWPSGGGISELFVDSLNYDLFVLQDQQLKFNKEFRNKRGGSQLWRTPWRTDSAPCGNWLHLYNKSQHRRYLFFDLIYLLLWMQIGLGKQGWRMHSGCSSSQTWSCGQSKLHFG